MNKLAYRLLKDSGQNKIYFLMIALRLPFDALRAIYTANLLEKFLRAIDSGAYTDLIKNFVVFLILGILLFGYNMLIWMTIAVKTSVGFQNGVKKNVFKALIKMSVSEMSAESVGDRITRLNNDTDTACGYLNAPVNYMHMVIALFNVIATIVFMGFINPVMLLLTVSVSGFFFLINTGLITRKVTGILTKSRAMYAKLTGMISPMIMGKDAVKIYDAKDFLIEKIEENSKKIMKQNMKAWQRTAISSFFMTLSGGLGYLILFIAGDKMMGNSIEDFAKLTKITQYRANMIMSIGLVNNCIVNMRGNLVGVKKVTEITSKEEV